MYQTTPKMESNFDIFKCVTPDYYDDTPVFSREISSSLIRSKSKSDICENDSKTTTTTNQPIHLKLNVLQAYLFATILEDVLTQLRIVGECNSQMSHYETQGNMTLLLSAKFGIEQTKITDELASIDVNTLDCESYKLAKLVADRTLCLDVLMNTYLDLALKYSFAALIKHRKNVDLRIDHQLFQIDEEARNKENYRELKRNLRHQRVRNKSSLYEINLVLDQLTAQLEDSGIYKSIELRYLEKWQRARTEQHKWGIREKETNIANAISLYRHKGDEEHRVHSEVESLNKIIVCELLQKIEGCMEKYEKDTECMDTQIAKMRIDYDFQLEQGLELEQRLAEHAAEMKDWVQFKTDREKARAYVEKMTTAAIVVQAWWRGLVVRLDLIKPRRPKKKGKNGKK